MKKLLFLLLLLPFLGNSQATFTAPVGYNTGAPTATPSGVGTRWRFDLLTGKKYTWLPGSLSWDEDARGIDQVAGCSAPLYTPGYNQSTFAVNSCTVPELYQWTGAAWVRLNEGEVYTAGTGISISGGNEISNTAPDQTVTMTDGTGIDVTGTYPNFTVTNTSPNVVQTLSIAGQDLTLSGGGGTVAIPADGNGIYGGSGNVSANTIAENTVTNGVQTLEFTDDVDGIYYDSFIGIRLSDTDGREAKAGLESSLRENPDYDPEDEESEETIYESPLFSVFLNDDYTVGDKSSMRIKIKSHDILVNKIYTDDADNYGVTTLEFGKEIYLYCEETDDGGATTNSGEVSLGIDGISVTGENPTGTINFNASPGQVIFDANGSTAAYTPGAITNTVGDDGEILFQSRNPISEAYTSLKIKGDETIVTDAAPTPFGIQYAAYYPDIETNDPSLTSVQNVNSLKQKLATYTTTQRNAIPTPATGYVIFCTDATATDGSTGVQQIWNGSAWKNAW